MTARDHNNLLGIFFMIQGGIVAFVGVLMALLYLGIGGFVMSNAHRQDDQVAGGIMMGVGVVVGIILIGMASVEIFTGIKIRRVSPTGRIMGIIFSILALFSFPLGTALGIYGLWFLLGDMGKGLYLGGSAAPVGSFNPPNPPPPNSWA